MSGYDYNPQDKKNDSPYESYRRGERESLEREVSQARRRADSEEVNTKTSIRHRERAERFEEEHKKAMSELQHALEQENARHREAKGHREAYEERHLSRGKNSQYGHD